MARDYDKANRTKDHKGNNLSAKDRAETAFSTAFANLTGALRGHGQASVERFSIRQRKASDFIAVASGADSLDGRPIVAFGSGSTMWTAIAALNGAISRGEWKDDRYRIWDGLEAKPLAPVVSVAVDDTQPIKYEQGEIFGLAMDKDSV